MKILLAIPTGGGIHEITAMTAAQLAARSDVDMVTVKGRPIDYNRNCIVRAFLANPDYTHLFLMDSDIGAPLDIIDRLIALDAPLASGCYPVLMPNGLKWAISNMDPDNRYRLLKDLPSQTKPFIADAGGAGCLMIRRDVFDRLDWPWFKWIEHPDGSQESEDIDFFRQCNAQYLKVMFDPTIICNHYKTINLANLMRAKTKN